ncbi:hypothetical protein [Bradyrhizobium sp. SZCCHNRI1073]|uniref:hypothetical protein n=1 Tax=Bradyrhizobium sp. SZCCHNRI1073 TaxID=3057280 RepID=UPI002916A557|nr:hypothetical protein [Bradyrhizobium sp. SZCCHNRI1073]
MTVPSANYPFPLGGHPNGRYRASLAQAQSSANNLSYLSNLGASAFAQAKAESEPEPAFEDAGIRAGEIIGYRAWELHDGLLHSMYAKYIWFPGVIERAHKIDEYWGTGLHAFKTLAHARKEYSWANVFGEVALWGEVYEHERGYRAEYAAIRRIIKVSPDIPFLRLRARILSRRYRVENLSMPPEDSHSREFCAKR